MHRKVAYAVQYCEGLLGILALLNVMFLLQRSSNRAKCVGISVWKKNSCQKRLQVIIAAMTYEDQRNIITHHMKMFFSKLRLRQERHLLSLYIP